MKKRIITVITGLILAGGLIYLFFHNVSWIKLGRHFGKIKWDFALYSFVFVLLNLFIRVHRWKYLLKPVGKTSFPNLFSSTLAGYAVTFFIPGRLGEIVRPYLLSRDEDISGSSALATVFVERILDLLTLFGFLFVFLTFSGIVENTKYAHTFKMGGMIALAICLFTLFIMVLAIYSEKTIVKTLDFIISPLPERIQKSIRQFFSSFIEGFGVLKSLKNLFAVISESILLWLVIGGYLYFALMGFDMNISFFDMFLLVPLTAAGIALPTPGGIGGFHELLKFGLVTFYTVEVEKAVASAIVTHAIAWIPMALIGGFYLWSYGVRLSELFDLKKENLKE